MLRKLVFEIFPLRRGNRLRDKRGVRLTRAQAREAKADPEGGVVGVHHRVVVRVVVVAHADGRLGATLGAERVDGVWVPPPGA